MPCKIKHFYCHNPCQILVYSPLWHCCHPVHGWKETDGGNGFGYHCVWDFTLFG